MKFNSMCNSDQGVFQLKLNQKDKTSLNGIQFIKLNQKYQINFQINFHSNYFLIQNTFNQYQNQFEINQGKIYINFQQTKFYINKQEEPKMILKSFRTFSKNIKQPVSHSLKLNNNRFYNSTTSHNAGQTTTVPEVVQKKQFITNLYGIEVKKHIFPHFTKKVNVGPQQYKFYQKSSPNYIIALVNKVLDDFDANNDQVDIKNRFYPVCTYCKVTYSQNTMHLEGLYRCRIQDIHKMEIKSTSQLPQGNQIRQKTHLQIQEHQTQQDLDAQPTGEIQKQSNPFSIAQLLKSSIKKNKKHKKNQIYSLRVRKLQELPLNIYARLQMKFKYLIDTYIKMHNSVSGKYPIIFNIIDLYKILDHISNQCSELNSKKQDVQKCLQALQAEDRIDSVQKLLQSTITFTSYLNDIEKQAQNSLRNKKFYQYYSEIMKIAKQVVEGKKSKQLFLQKVTKDFYQKNPPEQIKQAFENQKDKYQHLDENSQESGVIKTYLQELSKIPYDVQSQQKFDLKFAQQVLDQQHYGMKDVKQAILQIIAVGKLKNNLKGKIFCLVGGPGLGKTTFAKSVAKSLNRKFYNISLGGVSDSSVLKGHRRTYVGAYSGKIIQALKTCGTNNPVILLDQIDKMGSSYHGDPRSQLLQILDPNQNSTFVDNFVDLPVDLSNVLFICSANYQQNISKPLIDRMERIKLTSYTNHQKTQIFQRHLLRRAIQKTGVLPEQFLLNEDVIQSLVQDYCMGEPGVRYLQKNIVKILQKVAYKIVTNEQPLPIKITKENLNKYLGNTYYRQKDHSKISKGVAISLGGGLYGGRLTYIQAFKKSHLSTKQHKRGLLFTGSLGDIFKQAMNISYSYARNFLRQKLSNTYLYENQVHIHAPDGAQKKDGSTDSLTVSSALISLALQKEVKKGVGLTGELTLHGKVLRTFGIKQKILVAKRQKLKQVIIPHQNYAEVQMLGPQIKQGITFHFVKQYSQVYEILFK